MTLAGGDKVRIDSELVPLDTDLAVDNRLATRIIGSLR
jgi:hypothetical protein